MLWLPSRRFRELTEILASRRPDAAAFLRGSPDYPNLRGTAAFYDTPHGTLAAVEVSGLPNREGPCGGNIFAMHIHSGGTCKGTLEDPFADAGAHYNPQNCSHPYHAGDLPPLFESGGAAFSAFLTGRFHPQDILGRTLIIHGGLDDFTTQPSGSAGKKIACGIIRR